jgi:hypothetical protein
MGELAVLEGPWLSGAWYWRSDLERSQRSCWLVSEGYGSPPSPLCGYYPTERWVDHVCEVHVGTTTPVQGRIWAWKQP